MTWRIRWHRLYYVLDRVVLLRPQVIMKKKIWCTLADERNIT